MKRFTTKMALAAVISAFVAPTYAAQALTVTNTPLPVTVQGQTTPVPVTANNSITAPLPVKVINVATNGGSASVNVTNPATNPVMTKDAFARVPLKVDLTATQYQVPGGSRRVIEFATASISCASDSGAMTLATVPDSGARTSVESAQEVHLPWLIDETS